MSKLLEIQRELKVLKSQVNTFGGYNYRSSEDILLALKPLLVKNECLLTISDVLHGMGEHVYIESVVTLKCDSEQVTASSFARDGIVQKGMNASQVTNSASSFAKKQALSNLFLIDDTAYYIPSKEEQVQQEEERHEIEEKQKEEKEVAEQKVNTEIETFINHASDSFSNALSLEELQAVYKVQWRESSKYGPDVKQDIENIYKLKKGEFL